MKRRNILAILMALAVMLGALPLTAAAAEQVPLLRADAVVYLWEAAGSPEPSEEIPFADVEADAAYAKAVAWAAEVGLTDGTGGGRFSPDAEVSRAQMLAFLWKQAGKPEASAEIPFADVAENAWYAPVVRWALEKGLIDAADSSFAPNTPVSLADLKAMQDIAQGTDSFLAQLQGSYIELFPAMSLQEYLPVWTEVLLPYCQSEEDLGVYYQMFTERFMSELYGANAVEAYAADPESAEFNCFFLQNVARFTVAGNTINGVDDQGNELFSHSYHFVEDRAVTYFGMELPSVMHIYESDGAASDGFRYFAFSDDTPAETYHLEFRYGPSLEGLTDYTDGAYAYWLASAISADYDAQEMTDCITLFVTENLGEAAEEEDTFTAIAGENGTTYTNLFSVILDGQYDAIWHDYCAAVVGKAQADGVVQRLKGAISADVYGPDAVAAYADGGYAFDCFFINDAALFTFYPDLSATVTLTDGTEKTFRYEALGTYAMGADETLLYQGMEVSMATEGQLYRSIEPAGEFTYFFFLPDTMETTYHLEFRYGSDLDDLMGYMKGPYAYWLAAGIAADADAETIERVIRLFCLENMDYSRRAEETLVQIGDFIGTWDADLSAFGPAYADVSLYFTIDEAGHGLTWMNGVNTADFNVYAYETEPGAGVYVAYDLTAYESEGAKYTIETDAAGRTVLTLDGADGTIQYVKRG